jgi:protoporphyrinogen oxidase
LLIASFNIIATSTVANVRTWISPIHAEAEEEVLEETEDEEPDSISFDHVLVNNQEVKLDEEGKISVQKDDAVRVSGNSSPNSSVTVYYADKEKTVTTNEYGYWFILFSITNMEEGQYLLTAKETDSDEESEDLITLVVGDSQETVEPSLDERFYGIGDMFESLPVYLLLLILIPLAIAFGWVLGTAAKRKINKEKK